MAAAIPEAAEAVSEGTASVRGAAEAGRKRRGGPYPGAGGRTWRYKQDAQLDIRQNAPRATTSSQARQRQATPRQQPTVQQRRQERLKGGAKRAGRGALKARLPGSHSYQPVILAEFIVAVLIVATGPIAKGGTPEAQTKGSPSPYSTNTLKQLIAIGGVYFVLALVAASQRAGRMAAWFGGLVLVALGLAELAAGDLSAVFKIFGPSSTTSTTPGVPAGQLVQLPPGFLPDASGGPPTPTGTVPTVQQFTLTQPGVITTDAGTIQG
jgi:hypothetical protein